MNNKDKSDKKKAASAKKSQFTLEEMKAQTKEVRQNFVKNIVKSKNVGQDRVKYNLFLDDVRSVNQVYKDKTDKDFIIVRTFIEFRRTVKDLGLPEFISFDNDLGPDENGDVNNDGYACAKWLVYGSGLDLRTLKYNVHSANPVAAEQIRGLLDNYIKHLNEIAEGFDK